MKGRNQYEEIGRVSLETWLKEITQHVKIHMDYIDRNVKLLDEVER